MIPDLQYVSGLVGVSLHLFVIAQQASIASQRETNAIERETNAIKRDENAIKRDETLRQDINGIFKELEQAITNMAKNPKREQ
ncbi:hypothetical protein PTNB73_07754 [Pyrenophora teres f. teres]|nr:hypothetical protein HRS9122_07004 [Pyrenophora teres f. teres]KAE8860144.1 hypothetical protein PTNB73_07754 [Pyrenophora teres f. teres]